MVSPIFGTDGLPIPLVEVNVLDIPETPPQEFRDNTPPRSEISPARAVEVAEQLEPRSLGRVSARSAAQLALAASIGTRPILSAETALAIQQGDVILPVIRNAADATTTQQGDETQQASVAAAPSVAAPVSAPVVDAGATAVESIDLQV